MAKQKKQIQNTKDKVLMAKLNEKIINDFLLQFAYTLMVGVVTIFVYNGLGRYSYGHDTYVAMTKFSYFLAIASFALGIFSAIWYTLKNKKGFITLSIYSFITTAVSLIYVSNKVVDLLKIDLLTRLYPNIEKAIFCIFPLLGIALVVEFAVYFIRYYKVNGKKKK